MPSKNLLKTKKQHRQLAAIITENTKVIALTPAAGALTGGTVGAAYSATTFASADAVGATVFDVVSGALPAGLSLNRDTGALTGTPTTAGANSFSVRVTDGVGNTKTNAYTLAIS